MSCSLSSIQKRFFHNRNCDIVYTFSTIQIWKRSVPTTAKVFTTGNSQAVRLPKAFRLDTTEVWISRNSVTGVITLKPKDVDQRKRNIDELFRLIAEGPSNEDFVPPRTIGQSRDPFSDEATPALSKRRKS